MCQNKSLGKKQISLSLSLCFSLDKTTLKPSFSPIVPHQLICNGEVVVVISTLQGSQYFLGRHLELLTDFSQNIGVYLVVVDNSYVPDTTVNRK